MVHIVTFASWCLKGATWCLAVHNAQRGSASQVNRDEGGAEEGRLMAGRQRAIWGERQGPDQSGARKALPPTIVQMQGPSLFLVKRLMFCSSWIFAFILLKRRQVLASLERCTAGAHFAPLTLGPALSAVAAELKA